MAQSANQNQGLDKAKMRRILVPAAAVAGIVILVALVVAVSGGGGRKMSDGSDGSADDPGLKELGAGVKYRDLKEGEGEACPPGAEVKMRYTGWLNDGTVFDSTEEGPQGKRPPAVFNLEQLIPGWKEGVPGMKPGGIRKIVVAPDKGYGSQKKEKIPPGSVLIFEVQLVDFAHPPRPRRSPAPSDLTKLADGTLPGADDPGLKPVGVSGLMYRDIKVGDGPVVEPGAKVTVDYIGWLTTGGTPFDNSWKGAPMTSELDRLVKGWQDGLPGMKVGGIRKLVIPAALGYGETGSGNAIPPNATLVFEIEVLAAKKW